MQARSGSLQTTTRQARTRLGVVSTCAPARAWFSPRPNQRKALKPRYRRAPHPAGVAARPILIDHTRRRLHLVLRPGAHPEDATERAAVGEGSRYIVATTALTGPAEFILGVPVPACLLDEAEQGVQNVSAYAAAVSATASTIVTAQLSSALGLG